MFTQTFVDGTTHSRTPYTLGVSFVIQTFALCALILVPLMYTQVLPNAQLRSFILAPAAPPAPHITSIGIKPFHAATSRPLFQVAPPRVFVARIMSSPSNVTPPPDFGVVGSAGDNSGANGVAGVPGSIIGVLPPPAEPPAAKPARQSGPIRIGGGVSESLLIHKVQPTYPPIAKSARVQGTVEFTAIIGRTGQIENLQLVRGHPLLVNAAKAAVLQWRYRPTLLNGQPVEVITDILVNFTLSQ